MSLYHPLPIIIFNIVLFISIPLTLGQSNVNALIAPIIKDSSTSLYTIALNTSKQFLIDLGGPVVWSACNAGYSLVQCTAPICNEPNSFKYPNCMGFSTEPFHPGFCKCTSATTNPVTGFCFTGDETLIRIYIASTNGRNPTALVYADYVNLCAPQSALTGLPQGAVGVAGFGRTTLVSLPARLAWDLSFYNKFALCLPSTTNTPGVAFFGDKPYYLLSGVDSEIDKYLTYTTLLKNPNSSDAAYYLDMKGLAVNGRSVSFSGCHELKFDSIGRGGVKLSTTIPYTLMRSNIFKPFIEAYRAATSRFITKPKVRPFELCFDANSLGSNRVGYAVPPIDIMLNDGNKWTIFGANSMKDVKKDTACLAFVDGGMEMIPAVTLGGFQMEDSFLLFDVPNSTLGFIPTLRGLQTTCSNFNFTSGLE